MNVSLTTRLKKLINQKVAGGLYHSASEVIRAGRHLKELRHEIALGLEESRKGQSKPLEMGAIKAEVRRRPAAGRKG